MELIESRAFQVKMSEDIEGFYLKPIFSFSFKPFKVLATETISHKALDADIYNAIPTEKVDGTCCYVTTYKGKIQYSLQIVLFLNHFAD